MVVSDFLLISAAILGMLVASQTRSPRGSRGTASAVQDRIQWLAQHPGEATFEDVEGGLRAEGLSPADVRLVATRARALGMKPFTMWMSVQTYGARELAVAVAGDLRHEELLEHLSEGAVPDFAELEVFAALNGLEAASRVAPGPSA